MMTKRGIYYKSKFKILIWISKLWIAFVIILRKKLRYIRALYVKTEMENLTLHRFHCWKLSMISQSILIVSCSTVNYCLYISVQSLSKQNSRTSRRDSSDTGDDRTPGEEIVGVCNGQQMAVSNRARDPRLTQSCITQWHILLCFACDFFLLVLRADMLLVYIWFLFICKKKGSWPSVELKRMLFKLCTFLVYCFVCSLHNVEVIYLQLSTYTISETVQWSQMKFVVGGSTSKDSKQISFSILLSKTNPPLT